jgi:superfamily II DNA or RNA helicase
MVDSWPDESTIIWCHYNEEQQAMEKTFPEAVSVSGDTPEHVRQQMIDDFKSGAVKVLITKPKILGFGINLQVCTRQIFSGLKDSYEEFYQAVKRSNRIGSTKPLNVHIPVTELEVPFVENVLRKADRVEADTKQQEELFKEIGHACIRR